MKSQLTTGKVTLELITDIVTEPRTIPVLPIVIPIDGGLISVPIRPIKPSKGDKWSVVSAVPYPWITTDPVDITDENIETVIEFTIAPNATGNTRTAEYEIQYKDADGNIQKSEPYIITQTGSEGFLLTENLGYLLQQNLDKINL
jgi:hypothetical protein